MISDYEAALFSQAAYFCEENDVVNSLNSLQSQWERIHIIESTSGLGISVFNNTVQQTTVIAFRGTKKIENIISDFELFLGWPITIGEEALNFYNQYKQSYLNKIVFTGHSLGGALACLMSLELGFHAITFDSPGCYRAAKNQRKPYFDKHKELIRTILGVPNLVNTCDKHLGSLLFAETSPAFEKVSKTLDILQDDLALASFIISPALSSGSAISKKIVDKTLSLVSTIYLHKMAHFLTYLNPINNANLYYIKSWCNWLNHLDFITEIPKLIRQKEISRDLPYCIHNPETNLLMNPMGKKINKVSDSMSASSGSLFFKTPYSENPIEDNMMRNDHEKKSDTNKTLGASICVIS